MEENAQVVVFPSKFAKNRKKLLVSNIKKILKIKNQKFTKITVDDSLIIIDANDPVFASSVINLLYGIDRIAIAKKIKNDLNSVVSNITKIGSNLLLKDETFFVEVDGNPLGYMPKDVELAATSKIIEKTTNFEIKPGTKDKHDKLLYSYITKSNAYISIFLDGGDGGLPYNSQGEKIICCIYDEMSALSCIECIKQGFDVKIIICYTNEKKLLLIIKILNHIIPRLLEKNVNIEFIQIKGNYSAGKKLLLLIDVVTKISISVASSNKINRISLALTPLIFPLAFIDNCTKQVFQKNLFPQIPIGRMDEDVIKSAKKIGLDKFLPNISKLAKMKFPSSNISQKESQKIVKEVIMRKKILSISVGPNNIHDILDSLKTDH